MGCCFFIFISHLWPRLTLALIWFFNPSMPGEAFNGRFWPVVGFVFLPTTTLAYEAIKYYHPTHGIDNAWLGLFALAFLCDLGNLGLGMKHRRRDG